LRVEPSGDTGSGLGIGPGGQDNGNGGDDGNGGSSGNGTPPGQEEGSASAAGATGLRVMAPATSAGLLETIVGGVTGFFFGG
jgi:hypothetical protein